MSLERHPRARIGLPVNFDTVGEDVDCESKSEFDLTMMTAGIKDVRGKGYDNSDPDDRMKAVVGAVQSLTSKGDVVFDYYLNFANEIEDLRQAQQALRDVHMHTLVGRSADRSTLFLVFAPIMQSRCVAVGQVRRQA